MQFKILNKYLLPFLVLFTLSVSAQQQNTLKQNMFDDLEVTNSVTKSYRDSSLTFHTKVLDEQKHPDFSKRYFWFHQGEVRSTVGNYTGKLLHGAYEKFDREGMLLEKGNFRNGLKEDTWIEWYPNGNVARHLVWQGGIRNGKFEEFNANGSLFRAGAYKNDKLDGIVYQYSLGTVVSKSKYRKGELVKAKEKKVKNKTPESVPTENKKDKKKKKKTDDVNASTPQQGTVTNPPAEKTKKRREKKSAEQNNIPPQNNLQPQDQSTPPAEVKTKKEKKKRKAEKQPEQTPAQP
jgi:antitoxin component YwqK of YwqJK toxin-antitoxin module